MTRSVEWRVVVAMAVVSVAAFSVTIFTGANSHFGEEGVLVGSITSGIALIWVISIGIRGSY